MSYHSVHKMLGALKLTKGKNQDNRMPITYPVLVELFKAINRTIGGYDNILWKAMFSLALHAFLRISEITGSIQGNGGHNIPVRNVFVRASSIQLHFESHKHSTRPVTVTIQGEIKAQGLCPVKVGHVLMGVMTGSQKLKVFEMR